MASAVRIAHHIVTSPDPEAAAHAFLPPDGPPRRRRQRSFAFDSADWVRVSPRYEQVARRAIGTRAFEAIARKMHHPAE
jgi:hypothetical protein